MSNDYNLVKSVTRESFDSAVAAQADLARRFNVSQSTISRLAP